MTTTLWRLATTAAARCGPCSSSAIRCAPWPGLVLCAVSSWPPRACLVREQKWAGNKLGTCSLTICQAGCAMRCDSSCARCLCDHAERAGFSRLQCCARVCPDVLLMRTLAAPGSSVAMILNTRGVNVNPGSLNSWLASHGGYESGCDIIWCGCCCSSSTSRRRRWWW